ncbi:MAG: hypothetical protein GOVbin709_23 [Prokaryotic dsDNA virus sp.]|nr:MAG: hypothetical protein GOVbin709_23 [Prokaryotic dsDNA virus sp.]|tara:strand:+ start:2001 stop:3008 length:1008 start_codon:yes stop_codon:yes gene_type:complete
MVYYCSSSDVGSRLGLNNAQRTQASSKIEAAIRRASIEIDQEFRDYGRDAPSAESGETTTTGAVSVGATTLPLTNGADFAVSGSGNINGDTFKWTGKDGAITSITLANAGSGYSMSASKTLTATGGTEISPFAGTYVVSATVASISLGGSNQNARDQSGGLHGPGTFTLNGAAGGTFTVADGVISNIQITNTTKFSSAPTVAPSNSTSFGDNVLTAVLASTGVISSVAITSGGVYSVAPTAIVISDGSGSSGSVTSAFTFNRLTGVTNVSVDHASGATVQEGDMAHVLREVCADLAAAFYMEDEGGTIVSEQGGTVLRDRGTLNLKRLAHLGTAH